MPDFTSRRTMMVDTQVRPSDVTKYPIIDAMLRVPREVFVPEAQVEAAYMGNNMDLGDGRVLLEPRTLAKMLDALNIHRTDLVLDLGCAYGYSAALIAQLAEAVVAIEEDEDLAREAESRLADHGVDNVAVLHAPLAEGAAKHGPYDAIVVEGGVETVPDALLDQLKEGGRIAAVFMDEALGTVRIGYKIDGTVNWRYDFNAGAPVLPGFAKAAEFAL
ncbi:protein-L-isoaspartate O-methyltransferase [Fluviibacterium sp. DFM31]|uniref:Protein-L-isoaspartate O-methyltransferase n=1 Tax=Meridianimarinicoccus marinus TaxID=3231483 RepID=A0ABV3L4Z5_9RHOB